METTHHYTASHNDSAASAQQSWLSRIEQTAEFNRYAIISVGFLIIGTLGGVVVGFFAREHVWQIATIVGFTMLSLTLMLAVAPMKYILRATAAALIVDVLMVLLNII